MQKKKQRNLNSLGIKSYTIAMDKKLKKYIDRYDPIQNCVSYELMPNGGMVVLMNQDTDCEVWIENEAYRLESFQAILMNAYESSVQISSNEELNLVAVRFRGAGASFFYEINIKISLLFLLHVFLLKFFLIFSSLLFVYLDLLPFYPLRLDLYII